MRILIAILVALPALAQVDRIVTVKPSGGDYTSLAAAIAGEKGNLVSLDRRLIIECYPMEDTAAVNIAKADWTVDATRHIIIRTPEAHRHSGAWSTSVYRWVHTVQSTQRYPFLVAVSYTKIIGLQIAVNTSTTYSIAVLYLSPYTDGVAYTVDSCIIRKAAGANTPGSGIYVGSYSNGTRISNNVIYGLGDFTGSYPSYGVNFQADNSSQRPVVYNNTVYDTRLGLYASGNRSALLVNNLSLGGAAGDFSAVTWGTGTDYNVSSDASAPGTNKGTGKASYSDYFTDHANGNFHLRGTSSALFGFAGSDLSGTFTHDLDQQSREESWDVGADEFNSAGRRRNIVIAWQRRQPWSAARQGNRSEQ